MRRPSRRSVLAVSAIASLGTGGVLSSVATASAAPDAQSRLLGLPLNVGTATNIIQGVLAGAPADGTLPPAAVDQLLETLTMLAPSDLASVLGEQGLPIPVLGQLLADGSPNLDQLSALLDALSQGDIDAALATLTPAQQQQAKNNMAAAKQQQFAKLNPKAAAPASKYFAGYRARVSSVKVAKNRRSARIRVSCPASSQKGCYVEVTGKVAGRSAMTKKAFLLARNSSQTATVKLNGSAAKRLKSKGGRFQLTAKTLLSSLPSATKTVTVTKAKAAKR